MVVYPAERLKMYRDRVSCFKLTFCQQIQLRYS